MTLFFDGIKQYETTSAEGFAIESSRKVEKSKINMSQSEEIYCDR
jgi:hypothetical protein